jgi:hypothetical protein
MAAPYAFVTLLTSDSYLPGALTLAGALKDLHPHPPTAPEVDYQTVCLITPQTVDVSTIKLLRRAFNHVIGVEPIERELSRQLNLLGAFRLRHIFPNVREAFAASSYHDESRYENCSIRRSLSQKRNTRLTNSVFTQPRTCLSPCIRCWTAAVHLIPESHQLLDLTISSSRST